MTMTEPLFVNSEPHPQLGRRHKLKPPLPSNAGDKPPQVGLD